MFSYLLFVCINGRAKKKKKRLVTSRPNCIEVYIKIILNDHLYHGYVHIFFSKCVKAPEKMESTYMTETQ